MKKLNKKTLEKIQKECTNNANRCDEAGITLVALVVTIVVLLILSGITIAALFSDNGIISAAQRASEKTKEGVQRDETQLKDLAQELSELTTGVSQKGYGDGVNIPQLGAGMIPIKWNGNNWVITTSGDKEWYSYNETDKKWANVMMSDGRYSTEKPEEYTTDGTTAVIDGDLGSMFVWIPRYAYQIESGYHMSGEDINSEDGTKGAGKINITFLKGNTNEPVDNVKIVEYNETTTNNYTKFPDGYVVHPAFNYGKQVRGLWVAKFEASHSDTVGVTQGSSTTLKVVPSVTSWRSITIGDIYTTCVNYNSTLNSHQMKNSEWGACAYFAHSKYGRNGQEVSVNQCSSYITGAGPSENAVYGESTYAYEEGTLANTYSYTTNLGKLASTTGNVYGIYDMSGGATEYVAAYVDFGSASANLNHSRAAALYGSTNNKNKDVYKAGETITDRQSNYDANISKYGDAMYETSSGTAASNAKFSWFTDCSRFPSSSGPFVHRGGNQSGGAIAGLFFFNNSTGIGNASNGFRPVLVAL